MVVGDEADHDRPERERAVLCFIYISRSIGPSTESDCSSKKREKKSPLVRHDAVGACVREASTAASPGFPLRGKVEPRLTIELTN